MFVETLIYSYLVICGAMIIFNIICIFVFQKRDQNLAARSKRFTKEIEAQVTNLNENADISETHRKMLKNKLTKINYLMAFDETLDTMHQDHPEIVRKYIYAISPVFVYLTLEYRKKSKLKAAYFPYIIKKYGVYRKQDISIVSNIMLDLVQDSNLYCRENALQALYAIGDAEYVVKALKIIDESAYFHNPKLLSDGLPNFKGDKKLLDEKLWQLYPSCSLQMQITLLNYFRFSSGEHCEKMLALMTRSGQNQEICLACIRYFGKYHYAPAFPYLLKFAENDRGEQWEYAAIAALSLEKYPCDQTLEILKKLLKNPFWYVRYNASQSIKSMNVQYEDLMDIFEGQDRYAGEMLRYRMDQRKMEREAAERSE